MREQWINFQAALLQRLPPAAGTFLSNVKHIPSYASWRLNPAGRRQAIKLLEPYSNRYQGFRCVIIGNGPSLREMDLAPLKQEFTFGLNRIYLLFDELGFRTDFLVAINRYVLNQFAEELAVFPSLKIFNWSYRHPALDSPSTCYLETKPIMQPDGNLLAGYYAGGGTVTNVALQAAYFMGFSEVILVGVDHNYQQKGRPNKAVTSNEADESHFSRRYFGPGVVWQLPDLAAMERGFEQIRLLFDEDNRSIIDATRGGKLQVFPKADFQDVLETSNFQSRAGL